MRNSVLSELRTDRTQNHLLWFSPLYDESANHQVITRLHKRASAEIGQMRRRGAYQIVANDIEVNPFGRRRGDVRKLVTARECVLHKWMLLRTKLAQPI